MVCMVPWYHTIPAGTGGTPVQAAGTIIMYHSSSFIEMRFTNLLHHLYITICIIAIELQCSYARPEISNENDRRNYINFIDGLQVGIETFLSLLGYYEEEAVRNGVRNELLDINPVGEESQTEIKIVGLGLGRTGTTSLVMALEILGYTVIHDDEHTELTDIYAAEQKEDIDMDEMHEILGLRGYNATFKTAGYRWVARHDEVKAILTVRDNADKYVDSWIVAAPFIDIVEQRPFSFFNTAQELLPSFEAEFKYETTGDNPDKYLDRETLHKNYDLYNKKVQDSIPKERLLIFNVKEGWKPLCQYLGHPIPEGISFPHVHTRAKLQGEMFFLYLVTWVWPLIILLTLLVLRIFTKQVLLNCFYSKKYIVLVT